MTAVKNCPSCQKELPITAINCKYCGEDLEPSSTKSFFDVPGQTSPAPAMMAKPALPPRPLSPSKIPPAKKAAAEDDWIPEAEHSKLIDLSDLSSLAGRGSSPVKAAPPPAVTPEPISSPQEKTEIMAYPDMILRANADAIEPAEDDSVEEVSGLFEIKDDVKEDIADEEIEDVDSVHTEVTPIPAVIPAPVPAPASVKVPVPAPVPIPAPAPASVKVPVEGDEDWIPDSEPSALIDLTENSSVAAVLMPGARPAAPAPVTVPMPTPARAPEKGAVPMPRPSRPAPPLPSSDPEGTERVPTPEVQSVSSPETAAPRPKKSSPVSGAGEEKSGGFHFSTRTIVMISAGVFVLTLGLALLVMVITQGSDEDTDETEIAEVVELKQPDEGQNRPGSGAGVPAKSTDTAATTTASKGKDLPAAGTKCPAFSKLDDRFPWRTNLEMIASGTGRSKVCEWFGSSSSSIAGAIKGLAAVGPTGSDWIADGGRLEVFPGGTVGSREPAIEFLFAGDKLYRVSMRFRDAKVAKKYSADSLEDSFARKSEGVDSLGRKVVRFEDGDLNVQWIEEEWYGRKLKTLVFSSRQIDEAMAATEKERAAVEVIYNAAEGLYATWKFDGAQEKYEEVVSRMPSFGPALNRLGLILSRKEKFTDAAEMANKALKVTREDQVKAEANTILAMAALYAGDTVGALKYLKAASEILPADAVYKDYVKELEAGIFSDSRLAKTAARMECLKEGKSTGTEKGILARGNFPNKMVYLEQMVDHGKGRAFDKIKKSYKAWECP